MEKERRSSDRILSPTFSNLSFIPFPSFPEGRREKVPVFFFKTGKKEKQKGKGTERKNIE